MKTERPLKGQVGLFFVVEGKLLLHACDLADGEKCGYFINYPESHNDVWEREYYPKYLVDFDYFPRGRIIFNRKTGLYLLYHDVCVTVEASGLRGRYPEEECDLVLDEHYQCHQCNRHYVV